MMVAFAAVGSGQAALNVSEKAKMEERLMVQRLRNQGIVPSASARPPARRLARLRQQQRECQLRRAPAHSFACCGCRAPRGVLLPRLIRECGLFACVSAVPSAAGADAGADAGDDY